MSDPKRLVWESANEVERLLLRAGRVQAPKASRDRAFLVASSTLGGALATSSGTAGGTMAGKSVAAGITKAGSVAMLKWMGVVGVAGIGAVTGAMALRDAGEGTASTNVAASAASSRAREGQTKSRSNQGAIPDNNAPAPVPPTTDPPSPSPTETTEAPTTEHRSPASTAPGTSPAAGESRTSTVRAEVAMLDKARGALAAGEPARALSILDGYGERVAHGDMAPEAAVLRIEALVKAGDRSAAGRFADAFLAGDPSSPYLARVQSLLATTNP
jgi:hypothetical protein